MRRLATFLALALALLWCAPLAADFLYPVTPPIKLYTDQNGLPLENGYIYFGQPNQDPETTPKQMYWDAAGTIPAAQPIRTVAGYITNNGTPANIFSTGDHSVTVKNRNGVLIFTYPTSTDLQLALNIAGVGAAAAVPIADAGGYYTTDNVEAALQQAAAPGFLSLAKLAGTDVLPFLAPTGSVMDYVGVTAPNGWVVLSGRTIGSASSGATERANADTASLYTLLWNNWSNTELPIEDSAGTPTTRGASASNDFAANKRLPLPDCRDRVRAGKGNMGGSSAGRLTAASGVVGNTMGETGGTETHTLVSGEMPSHTHVQDAHNHTQNSHNHTQDAHNHLQDAHNHTQGAHNHIQDAHTHVQDSHNHSTVVPTGTNNFIIEGGAFTFTSTSGVASSGTVATNQLTIATNQPETAINVAQTATNQAATATNQAATATNQAATATNQAAGSGDAHLNVQPTIVFSVIIKLRCVPRGVDGLMVPVN